MRRELLCMVCFYYSSRPLRCVANINYACMREISVDEVFAAVQNLLAKTNEKPVAPKASAKLTSDSIGANRRTIPARIGLWITLVGGACVLPLARLALAAARL